MGYNKPGERNGTGPSKDSDQRNKKGDKGKRKERGEDCPNEKEEKGWII